MARPLTADDFPFPYAGPAYNRAYKEALRQVLAERRKTDFERGFERIDWRRKDARPN